MSQVGSLKTDDMVRHAEALIARVQSYGSVVVAFSGGVDSAVVAYAAQTALGEQSVAATGIGAAVSQRDLHDASTVAQAIGIRHVWLPTDEIHDERYRANQRDRCYHCKSHLFERLLSFAKENNLQRIVSGTNADDLNDYRPGLLAGKERQVQTPLADLGFGKQMVRGLASLWNLSIATKPASPCLASRIAYGEEVAPERLRRIEQAESLIRQLGIEDVRVRYFPNEVACIEVPLKDLQKLAEEVVWGTIQQQFRSLGFRETQIAKDGLQSGRLNRLPIVETIPAAPRALD